MPVSWRNLATESWNVSNMENEVLSTCLGQAQLQIVQLQLWLLHRLYSIFGQEGGIHHKLFTILTRLVSFGCPWYPHQVQPTITFPFRSHSRQVKRFAPVMCRYWLLIQWANNKLPQSHQTGFLPWFLSSGVSMSLTACGIFFTRFSNSSSSRTGCSPDFFLLFASSTTSFSSSKKLLGTCNWNNDALEQSVQKIWWKYYSEDIVTFALHGFTLISCPIFGVWKSCGVP